MRIIFIFMICTIHSYNHKCNGIHFIDLPAFGDDSQIGDSEKKPMRRSYLQQEHIPDTVPEKVPDVDGEFDEMETFDKERNVDETKASVEKLPLETLALEDSKPVDPKPVESASLEPKPVKPVPLEPKSVEFGLSERKSLESDPSEPKPAEQDSLELKPAEVAPLEPKPNDPTPSDKIEYDLLGSEPEESVASEPKPEKLAPEESAPLDPRSVEPLDSEWALPSSSSSLPSLSTPSLSPEPPPRSERRGRRHWMVSAATTVASTALNWVPDKDENIKNKINSLVQQTVHDTETKVKSVQKLKERHRENPAYRVGFILSMLKKSRDVLNQLFNIAVKHRDQWRALEQLKIFELIVHTNVDSTNLVRQLVEIHISNINSTNKKSDSGPQMRSRVVIM